MRVLAAFLALLTLAFAAPVLAQDTGISIPGCPLSGCTYTGGIAAGPTGIGVPVNGSTGVNLNPTNGAVSGGRSGANSFWTMYRTDPTGTAGATIGAFGWQANDSAGTGLQFGSIRCVETAVAAGAASGTCTLYTAINSALTGEVSWGSTGLIALSGYGLTSNKIISPSGAAPTLATCGTSPSLRTGSSNMAGEITVGTGGTTTCALSFNTGVNAYTNAPSCTVTEQDGGTALAYSVSATGVSMTFSASKVSIKVNYACAALVS